MLSVAKFRCAWSPLFRRGTLLVLAFVPMVAWSASLGQAEAVRAYESGDYATARAAFERLVAAEPENAAAHYYLGQIVRQLGNAAALEAAIPRLERAVALAPDNAEYHADLGGVLLQLAQKKRSLLMARRGRNELEETLRLDPSDTDTRHALFVFYLEAPWPLSDAAKARAHGREIARADPPRGAALLSRLDTEAKRYDAAFQQCEKLLAEDAANFTALCEFGRAAAASGRNLPRGLHCLELALAHSAPHPEIPSAGEIWLMIGTIHEKLGQRAEAQRAYEAACRLDPDDDDAATALARLKK